MDVSGINGVEAQIRAIEQQTAAFGTPAAGATAPASEANGAGFASALSDAMNVSALDQAASANGTTASGASGAAGGTSVLTSLLNGLGGAGGLGATSSTDTLSLLQRLSGAANPSGTPHSSAEIATLLASLQTPSTGTSFDANA
jgi:hypothetical protein